MSTLLCYQVDEYIALPDITDLNRHVAVTYRDSAKSASLIRADRLMSFRRDTTNCVYTAQCRPLVAVASCKPGVQDTAAALSATSTSHTTDSPVADLSTI